MTIKFSMDRIKNMDQLYTWISTYSEELGCPGEEEHYHGTDYCKQVIARVLDNRDGSTNRTQLQSVLMEYAGDGWKLHSVITNELGENSNTVGIGGLKSGTNASIDEILLIFERMVSKGNR